MIIIVFIISILVESFKATLSWPEDSQLSEPVVQYSGQKMQ